ncbi:hypothetical protein F7725_009388 [Dissostichus mawsoni]|uniref:Uncharacterized protein n=1 Tax=Dissostichus mawsoni TaxID=36200 RepID=A0A7J5Z902_DISMA|nr:hypothetical protein F7725_009388 [Dissostichus mawsoni]
MWLALRDFESVLLNGEMHSLRAGMWSGKGGHRIFPEGISVDPSSAAEDAADKEVYNQTPLGILCVGENPQRNPSSVAIV